MNAQKEGFDFKPLNGGASNLEVHQFDGPRFFKSKVPEFSNMWHDLGGATEIPKEHNLHEWVLAGKPEKGDERDWVAKLAAEREAKEAKEGGGGGGGGEAANKAQKAAVKEAQKPWSD